MKLPLLPLWASIPGIAALGLLLWIKPPHKAFGDEVVAPAPVAHTPLPETQPYNNGQPEDRYFSPDPHWKVERELWEMRGRPYERPIAPAQRVKVPCWEYGDECGVPGGACGKLRKLSDRDLYKEECDALRPKRRPEPHSYSRQAPRCPRGGCPVDDGGEE